MSTPDDMSRIQEQPLALEPLLAWNAFPECGGLAMFAGTVRDHHDAKRVLSLTYTAYAPLAEKQIRDIERAVATRYGAPYVRVVHRVGPLAIGEMAICCVARAPHRAEAFAACKEAVDRVKHEVPVWKEEFYADGTSAFVEGCCIRTDLDDAAAQGATTPQHDHRHEHAHDHQHRHA